MTGILLTKPALLVKYVQQHWLFFWCCQVQDLTWNFTVSSIVGVSVCWSKFFFYCSKYVVYILLILSSYYLNMCLYNDKKCFLDVLD